MGCSSKIRWGLALLGGVLAGAGILAVMPVALRFGDQTVYLPPLGVQQRSAAANSVYC